MRTAYKCRAYPTPEQAAMLSRTFGCVRAVWNKTLAARQARYTTEQRAMSYRETDAALTAWKRTPELAFLAEVSSVPLQQTLRHQNAAFTAFFSKRARYPRFKTRHGRQTAHYTRSAFRVRDGQLWLAKATEPLRLAWSWPGVELSTLDPTTVVISREPDGRWFVSFAVEAADPEPLPDASGGVGIDLGLKDFAVLSSGERIAHPHDMDRRERRLKRYQRMLARRQPGSANRAKARVKVAREHSRVRDARRDFLHKVSTDLVRRFNVIAVEDLNVSGMVRNRRMAKAISRAGWSEFRDLLAYKAERAGRRLVVVDRWYPSSKTCSACGHLLSAISLGTRHWQCPTCGTRHDRDVNAAKNILVAAGLVETQNACRVDVRPRRLSDRRSTVKQEPQRATVGPSAPAAGRITEVKMRHGH
jgi:putative transposase